MAAKRAYKRDARGRFAGGGGGGGKSGGGKPAAKSKPASKPKTPKAPPKTTTARGRARQAEAAARQAVKAGGGSSATRSLLVAQRARDYYRATGTGTKRSKAKGAATEKPQSRPAPSSAQQRAKTLRARATQLRQQGNALMSGTGRRDGAIVNLSLSSRARSASTNAGFRGLEMTRRADRLEWRARGVEVKAAESAAKAAREAAKPKKPRNLKAERVKRAQGIVQRREQMTTGSLGQWENSVRTERRALSYLGAKQLPLTGQQQFWRDMVPDKRSRTSSLEQRQTTGPRNTQPPKPRRKRKPKA